MTPEQTARLVDDLTAYFHHKFSPNYVDDEGIDNQTTAQKVANRITRMTREYGIDCSGKDSVLILSAVIFRLAKERKKIIDADPAGDDNDPEYVELGSRLILYATLYHGLIDLKHSASN